MKPDAFMKVYPGDWLRDTMQLDATATGAYWLLILAHRGKPGIPSDDQTLRTITRVKETEWCRVKGQIQHYFRVENGLWINNRSVEDWDKDCAEYKAACARTNAATLARKQNVTSDVTKVVTTHQSESESESESVLRIEVGRNGVLPKRQCDEKWLSVLQSSAAYRELNVTAEYSKMVHWCEVKRKKPTQARLLAWLNRIEKPMAASVNRKPF